MSRRTGTLIGLLVLWLVDCRALHCQPWPDRLRTAETALAQPGLAADQRFYGLTDAAKAAFETGQFERAERYADELLELAPQFRDNWNYGNAVHDGHVVLGRLALLHDDVEGAVHHLSAAGETPGSPQLDSFGPNMSLARDLLQREQWEAVLAYLQQCGRFWKLGHDRLDEWSHDVESRKMPAFGPNLLY